MVEVRFRERAMELFAELQRHRRWLHQHPEPSFREQQTAAYIRQVLQALAVPYRTAVETGTIGWIGHGEPCVALRADIDALPVEERTGLPFASQHAGFMHACGHDMHAAMLLGAAALLKECEPELEGTVLVVFQPGEEQLPGGASLLLAEGALQEPAPIMMFAQHVYPELPVGQVAITAGPVFAATDELYWTLQASGGHAAQPNRTGDPIVAAAELILHVQTLISRRREPLTPAVLSVTAIHGGTAPNVIPSEVRLQGTLRCFDLGWRQQALESLRRSTLAIAAVHGVEATLEVRSGYPPLLNDKQATDLVEQVAAALLGEANVLPLQPMMWAEDFAYYSQRFPSAFWLLGVRPPDREAMAGLHHPSFAPSEEALPIGAALMAAAAWRAVKMAQV
ncbi:MAG: M20 family metallopeptidase [Candidatus Kapabacteria bacterium]|nr:M20 family metallopeptidase [Candidatus Kapabacteria bacterium]MCS7169855.1 M20 family metallopeptidase [Candidatus Kapabacteria bacterium]MDW7996333.1 M20 family metallopeptidase [Bacteroidota bacterium]MDW8225588.1 M20 family metallopeptidase [Bacteroidota bacterium]